MEFEHQLVERREQGHKFEPEFKNISEHLSFVLFMSLRLFL